MLPKTAEGKVVLWAKDTGKRYERWPVDANEMLRTGGYTLEKPGNAAEFEDEANPVDKRTDANQPMTTDGKPLEPRTATNANGRSRGNPLERTPPSATERVPVADTENGVGHESGRRPVVVLDTGTVPTEVVGAGKLAGDSTLVEGTEHFDAPMVVGNGAVPQHEINNSARANTDVEPTGVPEVSAPAPAKPLATAKPAVTNAKPASTPAPAAASDNGLKITKTEK